MIPRSKDIVTFTNMLVASCLNTITAEKNILVRNHRGKITNGGENLGSQQKI